MPLVLFLLAASPLAAQVVPERAAVPPAEASPVAPVPTPLQAAPGPLAALGALPPANALSLPGLEARPSEASAPSVRAAVSLSPAVRTQARPASVRADRRAAASPKAALLRLGSRLSSARAEPSGASGAIAEFYDRPRSASAAEAVETGSGLSALDREPSAVPPEDARRHAELKARIKDLRRKRDEMPDYVSLRPRGRYLRQARNTAKDAVRMDLIEAWEDRNRLEALYPELKRSVLLKRAGDLARTALRAFDKSPADAAPSASGPEGGPYREAARPPEEDPARLPQARSSLLAAAAAVRSGALIAPSIRDEALEQALYLNFLAVDPRAAGRMAKDRPLREAVDELAWEEGIEPDESSRLGREAIELARKLDEVRPLDGGLNRAYRWSMVRSLALILGGVALLIGLARAYGAYVEASGGWMSGAFIAASIIAGIVLVLGSFAVGLRLTKREWAVQDRIQHHQTTRRRLRRAAAMKAMPAAKGDAEGGTRAPFSMPNPFAAGGNEETNPFASVRVRIAAPAPEAQESEEEEDAPPAPRAARRREPGG